MRTLLLACALLLCGMLCSMGLRAQPAALPQCPDDYVALQDEAEPFACQCPADATGRGSVWGTDVYTADSSVCRAALHAGMVGRRGGPVTVEPAPGRRSYYGTTRNGLSSSNYGPYDHSFRFTGTRAPAPAPDLAAAEPCPDTYDALAGDPEPLACICEPGEEEAGAVWGTEVYTADSKICRAALHAGVIKGGGGPVVLMSEPGRRSYPGTTRNGVTSSSYGTYGGSYRFVRPEGGRPETGKPASTTGE